MLAQFWLDRCPKVLVKEMLRILIKLVSETTTGVHPIDSVLSSLLLDFQANFTKTWSKHTHVSSKEPCNKIIVIDGNWKINRAKCAADNIWRKSLEFGEYRIGCPNTPERGSYFCDSHKAYKLEFCVGDRYIQMMPGSIKISRLSNGN